MLGSRNYFCIILLVCISLLYFPNLSFAQLVGGDTAAGESCAGFPEGATRMTADANQDGVVILICDGTTWEAASSGDPGGNISVCPTVGDSIISDGSDWQCTSDYTPDVTPDSFTFTDETNVTVGTTIESNIVTITGMNAPAVVSISGEGSPEFRVQSGSWVSSGMITSGQTLQLRLNSSPSGTETRTAVISVGTAFAEWSVTTENLDCSGEVVGEHCWYVANGFGVSCDDVCSSRGGCDLSGTRDYAGSGGTNAQCAAVLDALSLGSGAVFSFDIGEGVGCFYDSDFTDRFRDTSTTTCSASIPDPAISFACACAE